MRAAFELPEITELNPNVPESLASIIMKACAHDPEHRYQTAAALQHSLNRFAHGKSVFDRRLTERDRYRKLLRPQHLLAGFITVFMAGMVFQNVPDRNQAGTVETAGIIVGSDQHFEIADGANMARTVLPTMNQHTGLGCGGSVVERMLSYSRSIAAVVFCNRGSNSGTSIRRILTKTMSIMSGLA